MSDRFRASTANAECRQYDGDDKREHDAEGINQNKPLGNADGPCGSRTPPPQQQPARNKAMIKRRTRDETKS
jgi:hypothetical protein